MQMRNIANFINSFLTASAVNFNNHNRFFPSLLTGDIRLSYIDIVVTELR